MNRGDEGSASRASRRFLTAAWRDLVILNYAIDPAVLSPLVPRRTELDLWHGRALVSMVGFRFLHTRVMGLPIPWHQNFDEINLRFYVRRMAQDGWRRGVVFVKEVVPRSLIATVARMAYNEPYVAHPMRHLIQVESTESGGTGRARYQWKQDRWYTLEAEVRGPPRALEAGSEAEFITEHYWGYTRQRDGGTIEYRVEHPRWRVWTAESSKLDCDVERMYGTEFVPALSVAPESAFLAEGSPVSVFAGQRI